MANRGSWGVAAVREIVRQSFNSKESDAAQNFCGGLLVNFTRIGTTISHNSTAGSSLQVHVAESLTQSKLKTM